MNKETKNNGHPEGCIYEQFAYPPDLVVYTNSADMNMNKETKNNGHPEGCIYEQFAYPPDLVVYTNSADMNELSAIAKTGL